MSTLGALRVPAAQSSTTKAAPKTTQ
jgi:hypothetical protein